MIKRNFLFFISTLFLIPTFLSANTALRDHLLYKNWPAALELIANSTSINPDMLMFDESGPYGKITALNYVAQEGQFQLALAMLKAKKGCNPEGGFLPEKGSTVLWHATVAENMPDDLITMILTEYDNIDVNARPISGAHMTVLGNLASRSQKEFVQLINNQYPNADFNAAVTDGPKAGKTPLWLVARMGDKELFSVIIRKPRYYDFNAIGFYGKSVFDLVIENRWWDLALEIIDSFDVKVSNDRNEINIGGPIKEAIKHGQWDLLAHMIKKLPLSFSGYTEQESVSKRLVKNEKFDFCAALMGEPARWSINIVTKENYGTLFRAGRLNLIAHILLHAYYNFEQIENGLQSEAYGYRSWHDAHAKTTIQNFTTAAQKAVEQKIFYPSDNTDVALEFIKENEKQLYSYLGEAFTKKILQAFERYVRKKMMVTTIEDIAKNISAKIALGKTCDESCIFQRRSSFDRFDQIKTALTAALTDQNISLELLTTRQENVVEQLVLLQDSLSHRSIKNTLALIFAKTTPGTH